MALGEVDPGQAEVELATEEGDRVRRLRAALVEELLAEVRGRGLVGPRARRCRARSCAQTVLDPPWLVQEPRRRRSSHATARRCAHVRRGARAVRGLRLRDVSSAGLAGPRRQPVAVAAGLGREASSSTAASSKRPTAPSRRRARAGPARSRRARAPAGTGPTGRPPGRPGRVGGGQVGEHAGDDRPRADGVEVARRPTGPAPCSVVNSVSAARRRRAPAAVERVEERGRARRRTARGSGRASRCRPGRRPQPPADLDGSDGKRDRDAEAPVEHHAEERVARVVVGRRGRRRSRGRRRGGRQPVERGLGAPGGRARRGAPLARRCRGRGSAWAAMSSSASSSRHSSSGPRRARRTGP